MKHSKKVLAILLSCMLTLTACGSETNLEIATDVSSETAESTAVPSVEQTEEVTESVTETMESTSSTEESSVEESSIEESSTEETVTEETSEQEMEESGITFKRVEETVYTTASVRMRMQPEIAEDNIFDVLPEGTELTRIGYNEEWSKVRYDGESYYVSSDFLSAEKTEPESENVAAENKKIVCIDAGHQQHGISDMEPNAPGSTVMKAKLTTGTQGVATGKNEYQLNLEVALKVKQELIDRGYQVVMIRETNDCPLSNAERAQVANQSGASIFIRIHANSSTDPAMNGCLTMAPTAGNPYVGHLAAASQSLSQSIVDRICGRVGFRNIGVLGTDDMTGINWCTIPVTIVEMGYMSNPNEDVNLSDSWYQGEIAKGIVDGVDQYFASH